MAGIMTVVIAHTTGHSPATAIGLALPFSILMQYIILFYYSAFSVFTKSWMIMLKLQIQRDSHD